MSVKFATRIDNRLFSTSETRYFFKKFSENSTFTVCVKTGNQPFSCLETDGDGTIFTKRVEKNMYSNSHIFFTHETKQFAIVEAAEKNNKRLTNAI